MSQPPQDPTIYFEATGIYSRVVEHFCEINDLRFCRLNPLELHLKSESLRRVKTDQRDAHRIALTVRDNNFRLTIPWSKDYLRLHELSRFYNQLNADWNYRLNHLHTALEQTFPQLKQLFVNRTSKLALNVVELFPHPALVNPYSRVKLKNILMSSTDFPGIGKQTAAQLMGELGDINRFDNANQLNAYVGIDIRRYQSGTFLGQDHINKRGNPIARKLLYFAVGNMIRQQHANHNHIVDYYYHLKRKGPHPKLNKVAMVACMNKTLKCLLSMIKHHQKYHYRYTDSMVPVKA